MEVLQRGLARTRIYNSLGARARGVKTRALANRVKQTNAIAGHIYYKAIRPKQDEANPMIDKLKYR